MFQHICFEYIRTDIALCLGVRMTQSVWGLATGWTVWGSNPGRDKRFAVI